MLHFPPTANEAGLGVLISCRSGLDVKEWPGSAGSEESEGMARPGSTLGPTWR